MKVLEQSRMHRLQLAHLDLQVGTQLAPYYNPDIATHG